MKILLFWGRLLPSANVSVCGGVGLNFNLCAQSYYYYYEDKSSARRHVIQLSMYGGATRGVRGTILLVELRCEKDLNFYHELITLLTTYSLWLLRVKYPSFSLLLV